MLRRSLLRGVAIGVMAVVAASIAPTVNSQSGQQAEAAKSGQSSDKGVQPDKATDKGKTVDKGTPAQTTKAAVASPRFEVQNDVVLPPGQTSGSRAFVIVGQGLAEDADIAKVDDVSKLEGDTVTRSFKRLGSYGGKDPMRWSYIGEFSGLGPNYKQTRQLAITLVDGGVYLADYVLSNRPSGNADYTITYDEKWPIRDEHSFLKLTVKANENALGPLTLASSTLASGSRTFPLSALALCGNPAGACGPLPAFTPNTPTEVFLRVAAGAHAAPLPRGDFNGKLKFEAMGLAAPKELSLNVVSMWRWAPYLGMALILAGVLLSLALLASRYYAAKSFASKPLVAARERMDELLERYRQSSPDVEIAEKSAAYKFYDGELRARINKVVPAWQDFFKAFVGADESISEAQAKEIQDRILGLAVMVLEGAEHCNKDAAKIAQLGSDPDKIKNEADARAFVASVMPPTSVPDLERAVRPKEIGTTEINASLVRAGATDAAVYVLVAVLAGYFALINGRPGFGTFADFVLCFLWGMGAPATVEGLKAMTKDKLATDMKFVLPQVPAKTNP